MVVMSHPAVLNSHAGFRKRCSGRFLHIVKNSSRSHGNNAGDDACDDEHAIMFLLFPATN